MPKIILKSRAESGNILLIVILTAAVMFMTTMSMLLVSSNSLNNAYGRVDWGKAYFAAENALLWATQKVYDSTNNPAVGVTNTYATANGTLPFTVIVSSTNNDPTLKGAWVTVTKTTNAAAATFLITSSVRVNSKVRTLQANVTLRPVSQVFDYEYFLNNWGWWWGSTITGNGAQRSNWDFDFRYSPTVNGAVYAADQVDANEIPITSYSGNPFNGLAGQDPTNLVHQGAQRVTMPNLLNFSNYTATALADTKNNGLWIGSTQVVFGAIVTNSKAPQSGLYIVGTPSAPVTIKGTVVIPGDVIIKGTVTGQGTLYVGGNLYVANDLTYAKGPDYTSVPETLASDKRDAWVQSNKSTDLIAYAVRGSILAGDVTNPDWINYCMNYPGSGLQYVGDESTLGQDGIAGTPDDGVPFLHADGSKSAWYDADGDGKVNANYNYDTDINVNSTRAANISGYPVDGKNNPLPYNNVATDNMGTLQGIFYTNHAAAMRLANTTSTIDGVIISRNEQMVFQVYLNLVYDSRVHSRYNNNPNSFINLGLPFGKPIQVNTFSEMAPNASNL